MKTILSSLLALGLVFVSSKALAFSDCTSKWISHSNTTRCELIAVNVNVRFTASKLRYPIAKSGWVNVQSRLRAGYLPENANVNFQGNILYLQGLGDSILNHEPLFTRLTEAGYRVIAFDYMGQGGSEGSMNNTRLTDIVTIGREMFYRYGRDIAQFPKPVVMGWSTGGLAAYMMAKRNLAKAVILLAPGLVPNFVVGIQDPKKLKFNQITIESLTNDRYNSENPDPHVDPIKPASPLLVPDFALDLVTTASQWTRNYVVIPQSVPGLAFLSGENDTYVSEAATREIVLNNAPHFLVVHYGGALHEIDNEVASVRLQLQDMVLNFLRFIN